MSRTYTANPYLLIGVLVAVIIYILFYYWCNPPTYFNTGITVNTKNGKAILPFDILLLQLDKINYCIKAYSDSHFIIVPDGKNLRACEDITILATESIINLEQFLKDNNEKYNDTNNYVTKELSTDIINYEKENGEMRNESPSIIIKLLSRISHVVDLIHNKQIIKGEIDLQKLKNIAILLIQSNNISINNEISANGITEDELLNEVYNLSDKFGNPRKCAKALDRAWCNIYNERFDVINNRSRVHNPRASHNYNIIRASDNQKKIKRCLNDKYNKIDNPNYVY